jgi:hypothetical protein
MVGGEPSGQPYVQPGARSHILPLLRRRHHLSRTSATACAALVFVLVWPWTPPVFVDVVNTNGE